MGYVYFIRHGNEDIFKIGMTTGDVDNRVRQLQTGTPEKLVVHRYIEHPDPAFLERQLHERLKDRRVNGEWFRVSPQEIEDAIDDNFAVLDYSESEDELIELSQGYRRYLYKIKSNELFVSLRSLRKASEFFYAMALSCQQKMIVCGNDVFIPYGFLIEYFPEAEAALREQRGFIIGSAKALLETKRTR